MAMVMYHCKSTSQGKNISAKNPKEAALVFLDEVLMGMYKVKLKKVNARKYKEAPDLTVVVTDSSSGKEFYFQYASMTHWYNLEYISKIT